MNPTQQEIDDIQKEYDFHELIREDILEFSGENNVDYFEEDEAISILINFPKYDIKTGKHHHNSFVIIMSEQYVLTIAKYPSKHIIKIIKTDWAI